MRKIAFILFCILFFASYGFGSENGETLFKSMGCISCHRPESTSKVNPSLKDIAQAYQGKQGQLASYLNGEGGAVVKPEKAGMMKRPLEKTKALTDQERLALADYILGHKP